MLESTEIGDDNDVLIDIIGVPSEVYPSRSETAIRYQQCKTCLP